MPMQDQGHEWSESGEEGHGVATFGLGQRVEG